MPHSMVELLRRCQVCSKRLLDDYACPASLLGFVQPRRLEILQDRLELVRRRGEIKKPVAARSVFLVDLFKTLGQRLIAGFIFEFALMIKNRFGERIPDFVAYRLS